MFDPNQKNVAHMYLGTVHNGSISYRAATMEKLPAVPRKITSETQSDRTAQKSPMRALERKQSSMPAPTAPISPRTTPKIIVFGKHAGTVVQSA